MLRRSWPFLLIAFILLLPMQAHAAMDTQISDKRSPTDPPNTVIQPNDIYGYVNFSAMRARDSEFNRSFWSKAAEILFGGQREGSYVVALELKDDSEIVGREVIASYSAKTTRPGGISFLGFLSSTKTTTDDLQWSGRLYDTAIPIRNGNNNLKVSLVTYYSDSEILTPQLFTELCKLYNSFAALKMLGLPTEEGAGQVGGLIDSLIGKFERKEMINAASTGIMSFAKFNQANPDPNSLIYRLSIKDRGRDKVGLAVTVTFETEDSLLATWDKSRQRFASPNQDSILSQAKIAKKKAISYLMESATDAVKSLLTGLAAGTGYAGADIGAKCSDYREALSEYFSNRDAAAVYWATLKKYSPALKQNSAYTDCINNVPDVYKSWNLDLSGI